MEKKNLLAKELFSMAVMTYVWGFIYSIVAAIEKEESWYEVETTFNFEVFLKILILSLALGSIILAMAAIVHYLFNIQNSLELLAKGKSVDTPKRQEKQEKEEKVNEATNKEILDTLLENGCITQEEYADACNRELMKIKNKII